MPKDSIVEIPSGSGNRYRYEYSEGKTLYRGPVGDAPEIGEAEFNMVMSVQKPKDWPEMEHTIKEMIRGDAKITEWFEFFNENYLPAEFDMMLKGYDERYDPPLHTGTVVHPVLAEREHDGGTFEPAVSFKETYVMQPSGYDERYIVAKFKMGGGSHEEFKIVSPLYDPGHVWSWRFEITNEQQLLDYVKKSWIGD